MMKSITCFVPGSWTAQLLKSMHLGVICVLALIIWHMPFISKGPNVSPKELAGGTGVTQGKPASSRTRRDVRQAGVEGCTSAEAAGAVPLIQCAVGLGTAPVIHTTKDSMKVTSTVVTGAVTRTTDRTIKTVTGPSSLINRANHGINLAADYWEKELSKHPDRLFADRII